jgi:hypothetical protein
MPNMLGVVRSQSAQLSIVLHWHLFTQACGADLCLGQQQRCLQMLYSGCVMALGCGLRMVWVFVLWAGALGVQALWWICEDSGDILHRTS